MISYYIITWPLIITNTKKNMFVKVNNHASPLENLYRKIPFGMKLKLKVKL